MSKTFSLSLNSDEIKEVCKTLNVRENDLSKSVKALLTGKKESSHYPEVFEQKLKGVLEEKVPEVEKISLEMKTKTIDELEKILGIRGVNKTRKIQSNGLYFQKNTEDFLSKFLMEWRGDLYKIPELKFIVTEFLTKEIASREYLARVGSM